jgi:AcrR family transcriptional regulator
MRYTVSRFRTAYRPTATPYEYNDHVADTGHPGSLWARPQESTRPALTREKIVRAAIELADAEGLKAVSIRQVAARLEARTMTLYSHIDSKDDLLALMADEITAEILIPPEELPADWREAISLICRRTREAVLRHPWQVWVVGARPQIGPNALRHVEQSLEAVRPLGLDPQRAVRVIGSLDDFTLGHVIRETMGTVRRGHAEDWEGMRSYMEQVVSGGDFPNLAPLLEVRNPPDAEESFEQGLAWMLDGIEREYGDRRPREHGDGGR